MTWSDFHFLKTNGPQPTGARLNALWRMEDSAGSLPVRMASCFSASAFQEVLGQYPHGPCADCRRIQPLVDDAQRERIDYLDFLDRLVIRDPGREVARIHDGFVGEADVGRSDRPAVVEPDAGAQSKLDHGIVFDGQQRFRPTRRARSPKRPVQPKRGGRL